MSSNKDFKTGQSTTKLAYLAGIIDGEGCFYIGNVKQGKYGNRRQWHTLVKITSCDKCLIDWLRNHFTGCSENTYRWTAKKKFYRPVYSWTISGKKLDYFLPILLPYFVIKKEHCKIMIEIRKTFKNWGSKRIPDDIFAKRYDFMKAMRKINSRFHGHTFKQ